MSLELEKLREKYIKPENVLLIVNNIADKLEGIELDDTFIQTVLTFIPKVNLTKMNKDLKNDVNKINNAIADLYIKIEIKEEEEEVNIHESLKKIKDTGKTVKYVYAKNIPGKKPRVVKKVAPKPTPKPAPKPETVIIPKKSTKTDFDMSPEKILELTKIFNYDSLLREASIFIDTRYKDRTNPDNSTFQFNLSLGTKLKTGDGSIIATGNVKSVYEISIKPFTIPYSAFADNYYNKITVTILELISDCFEAYEEGQFHFICSALPVPGNANLIQLVPDFDTYKFKSTVRLNNMTLRFGAPLAKIPFDKDRLLVKTFEYSDLGNTGEIEFFEPHNLSSSDLIYITGFTTNNPVKNLDIINEINRVQGHSINRVDNVKITIAVDFSELIDPIPNGGQDVEVFLGSKRIMIPMKIKYLVESPYELGIEKKK